LRREEDTGKDPIYAENRKATEELRGE